jgi:hypothetical protein
LRGLDKALRAVRIFFEIHQSLLWPPIRHLFLERGEWLLSNAGPLGGDPFHPKR